MYAGGKKWRKGSNQQLAISSQQLPIDDEGAISNCVGISGRSGIRLVNAEARRVLGD
jgi:hypothetical protein